MDALLATAIVLAISALAAAVSGIVALILKRLFGKLEVIHVLVNSQMDTAKTEIAWLRRSIAIGFSIVAGVLIMLLKKISDQREKAARKEREK